MLAWNNDTSFPLKSEPSPEPEAVQDKPKFEIKKRERKETVQKQEAAASEQGGEMFKLKKKSSVTPRKSIQKEEEQPAFAGFKLKKAETVKRGWDDGGLEKVDLKHHEFEKQPQEESAEKTSGVVLSEGVPEDGDGKKKKKKKVAFLNPLQGCPTCKTHQFPISILSPYTNSLFFTLQLCISLLSKVSLYTTITYISEAIPKTSSWCWSRNWGKHSLITMIQHISKWT